VQQALGSAGLGRRRLGLSKVPLRLGVHRAEVAEVLVQDSLPGQPGVHSHLIGFACVAHVDGGIKMRQKFRIRPAAEADLLVGAELRVTLMAGLAAAAEKSMVLYVVKPQNPMRSNLIYADLK
jgi:hypothetical protein